MTCLGDPCKRVRIILSGGVRGEAQQSLSFARYRGAMRRLAFAAQVCASIRSARLHWIMAPRLTPFEVGQIFALCREGFSHRDIAARVTRGRGPDTVSFGSVGEAVRRLESDPSWMGDRAPGSGRKRKTTAREDGAILRAAKVHRGKRKVNASILQTLAPTSQAVSDRTIRRRLRESGLRYLRRRSKTMIPFQLWRVELN